MIMKKIVAALVAASMFCVASPSYAVSPLNDTTVSMVNMNVSYAEQIIICNSPLGFTDYQSAIIFDNDGACIDPSSLILAGVNFEQWLNEKYPGGVYNWTVVADNGAGCNFQVMNGQPIAGQFLVLDTFITACSVILNRKVTTEWSLKEMSTGKPYVSACLDGQIGFYDNCLDVGEKPALGNSSNMVPGTVDYINLAADKLKNKFYLDYKGWLSYNKKLKKLRFTMSKSPVAVKIHLQKWVDYKWMNVYTTEKIQLGKMFVDYNKASSGKYRLSAVNAVGKTWTSKVIVLK